MLAIDDNKEITDMLSLYFESQGIEFTAINEGMWGLEAIRNKESNLVLLDLAMPNFSGLDVVDYLKKENLVESRNIIIFTASSVSNGLFDSLKKIGVKGVLKKPVDMNALEKLITRFRSEWYTVTRQLSCCWLCEGISLADSCALMLSWPVWCGFK